MYVIIIEREVQEGETFKTIQFNANKDAAAYIATSATNDCVESVHLIHFPDGMSGNLVSLWKDGMVEAEGNFEAIYASYNGKVEPNE